MKNSLDRIFSKDIVLPRYKFFESGMGSNMYYGKAERVLSYKLWQLEKLGFVKVGICQAIKHLTGDEPTEEIKSEHETDYEYVFNHHKNRAEVAKWGGCSKIYELKKRKLMKWPPLAKELEWSIKHCKLIELELLPPPMMMLRVFESRQAKLFNTYSALVSPQKIMLLGQVWELPPTFCGPNVKYMRTGKVFYFYLGDWSLT